MKIEGQPLIEPISYLVYRTQAADTQLRVSITGFQISISTINEPIRTIQHIMLADMIGLITHQVSGAPWLKQISFNSFPNIQGLFGSLNRQIREFAVYVPSEMATEMSDRLIPIITNRPKRDPKNLLIYHNPIAGANSTRHCEAAQIFLRFTNFLSTVIRTTHRGYCEEHLNNIFEGGEEEWAKYSGVVIVSGDGLVHEFVNSKMRAVLPLTHVPGGSGNAAAKTQTFWAGEKCTDEVAMYLAVKGK